MSSNLDRLLSQLNTSGLQQKDNPLYQVISQLIKTLNTIQIGLTNGTIGIGSGTGTSIPDLSDEAFITQSSSLTALPNSFQLLAGDGIVLDISVSNKMTISTIGVASGEWSVLTNGDEIAPEIIFAGGDVVMTFVG